MNIVNSPPAYQTSVAQKSRAKIAAHHRFKYGSPKLVDMMREKCRLRIKEARSDHLLRKRNIVQEEKALLESIVRQELSELEQDIALQELIFQELIAETDEWLFEEYERSECYQIDEFGEEVVFCPFCQKDKLVQMGDSAAMRCSCGVMIKHSGGIEGIGMAVRNALQEHNTRCDSEMQFFLEPDDVDKSFGWLNALCPSCDYCRSLTN
ncbi:RIP-like protein [Armigeres subalbatus]|uniref:RIP-like protein n=1 Tax=Armigeres subalbatus TaxID=124917 RepID=UPI002ED635E4